MKKSLLLSLVLTIAMVFAFAAPAFAAEVAKKGVDIEVGGVGEGSASVSTSIAVENPIAEIDKTLTLTQSGPGYKSAREGSTETEIDQEIVDVDNTVRTAKVTIDQYELKGYVEVKKDGTASSTATVKGEAKAELDSVSAVVSAKTEISATAQTSSDKGLAKAYAYAMGDITAEGEVWYPPVEGVECLTEAESDSIGKAVAKAASVRDNSSSSYSVISSSASAYHSYDYDSANSYAEMTVSQYSVNDAKNAIGETYGEVNGFTKAMATETCEAYDRLIASEAKADGLVKAGIEIKNPGYAIIDVFGTTGIQAWGDAIYGYGEYGWGAYASTDNHISSNLCADSDDARFSAKVWSLVKDAEAESSGTVAVVDELAEVEATSLEQATIIGKIVGKGAIHALSWALVETYGFAGDSYDYGLYAYSTSGAKTYANDYANKSFILAQVIQADAMTLAETSVTGTYAFTEIEGVYIDTVETMGNYSSALDYFGWVYNPSGHELEGDNYISVYAPYGPP